jgi:extradiol dioxygenase family protein
MALRFVGSRSSRTLRTGVGLFTVPAAPVRGRRPPILLNLRSCPMSTAAASNPDWPGFECRASPAPGSPFHVAFPVHDLDAARAFYGGILGCEEGRTSARWIDFSLHGHQIVAHWVGSDYRCQDYVNPVDGDEVPVPHYGLQLTVDQWHSLIARLRAHDIRRGLCFLPCLSPHMARGLRLLTCLAPQARLSRCRASSRRALDGMTSRSAPLPLC